LLNSDHIHQALASGAQFLFSPKVDIELIKATADENVPFIPGALSPTEILSAWEAGAKVVKVYPIQAVGGVSYIEILKGPLGQIPLIPTGGVSVENAKDFLLAGAIAVGLAGDLFPKKLVEVGDWESITQRVRTLMQRIATPAP
jgi:2-dehydro-3-deoxyphosphogluconate aldolase / (4S)-4-hydroxy-2-oxoglutarate aldolase